MMEATTSENTLLPGAEFLQLFDVREKGGIRLIFSAIADKLIRKYHPITFNKQIWIYIDGLYHLEAGEIETFVSEVARAVEYEGAITTVIREVAAYVRAHHIEREHPFDRYPDAVPVANGVLVLDWKLKQAILHDYSPAHMFTHRWPVRYDPDANDMGIIDAVGQYVDDDDLPALYQLPAQAVLHHCGFGPFKRSYIFDGPKDAGKSTYSNDLLNLLFGKENISGISLQEIGSKDFVSGSLEGKILNRYDDLDDIPLTNIGPFKLLTGAFSHEIERKHLQSYPGRITAVHVFATNTPPGVPERVLFDSAFWERWIYLRFNNVFEVNPGWMEKTFTAEAVSMFFNRVLETAFEIRRTGRLVYVQDPSEVKNAWMTAANPFQRFVAAEMENTRDPVLFDKGHLFRSFIDWCKNNEISQRKVPSTIGGFTKLIYGSGFTTTKRGKRGNQEWQYEARYTWRQQSAYRETRVSEVGGLCS